MGGKLFLSVFILTVFSLSFVSAAFSVSLTERYISRTNETQLNLTITAPMGGAGNLTLINITLPQGFTYIEGSNLTSLSDSTFTNVSTTEIYWNTSEEIFAADSSKEFLFNVTSQLAGDANIAVNVTRNDSDTNYTDVAITTNFDFEGYVKDDTGTLINGTNVSIYQFIESAGGPPSEVLVGETIVVSEITGFSLLNINASASNFKLKMVHYNNSGSANMTGTILPPFPLMMYYPLQNSPMNLNGSTFYLQPAATIRLNATNATGDLIKFGYEVMDQKVGFPVESNIMQAVLSADVVVPAGRAYTVMLLRDPSQFGETENCADASFMNDSDCPSPPKSVTITAESMTTEVVNVTSMNLSTTNIVLSGCMKIATGHNGTDLSEYNITVINPLLEPWEGFIPPVVADSGQINLSLDVDYNLTTHPECNTSDYDINSIGWYNISLMGETTYMLEFYARNFSAGDIDDSISSGTAQGLYLAGFQNITTSTSGPDNINITLYNLAGEYWAGGLDTINTSKMRINIQNASGDAVTTGMHVEVQVKNTEAETGTVNYVVESITGGTFYLPIQNNSNWAKVSVFPNDGPPLVKILNLSLTETNVTLVSIDFSPGGTGDKGLREMNASGDLVQINSAEMPIQIRFLRKGTTDVITEMNATDFNPLKALVAGSTDLEIKVTATNVTMKFNNFDMFSAKQPPMFAVMDNNSMAASDQTWKFGNFVPKDVYDNVTIIIPYDESVVNETWDYNISISTLYTEDQSRANQLASAWGTSSGGTLDNLPEEFAEYNDSRYIGYFNTTTNGVECDKSDSNSVCFMNTSSNEIYMEVPHFSGVSPGSTGGDPTPAVTAADSTDDGGTSGGGTESYWILTMNVEANEFTNGYSRELSLKNRLKIIIENETHYVGLVGLTSTEATINVSSTPQQAILEIGEEKKFEVTDDTYYDISVKLNEIDDNKANLTVKSVHELVPAGESPATTPAATGDDTTGGTGGTLKSDKSSKWGIILLLIVIAVVVIVVVVILFRKHNQTKSIHSKYLFDKK